MNSEQAQPDDRDDQLVREFAAYDAQWCTTWPNHCKVCGGWGTFTFYESHGFRCGGREQLTDLCERMPSERHCHRCAAADALADDGAGPCSACGWNYDDGRAEA
jgi:hypothetical protein